MTQDFLADFIGSAHLARVLRVFILTQSESFTLGSASKRAGLSSTIVAKEIKVLERLGILRHATFALQLGIEKEIRGKQKENLWIFNQQFKHAGALTKFVNEVSPAQHDVVLGALKGSGKIATVILSGVFMGDPSRPADLIVAADTLNESRLETAVKKLEPIFGREIRYAAFTTPEFRYRLTVQDRLMRDTLDFPHLVLFDRAGLL
jgi:hypothetical protein